MHVPENDHGDPGAIDFPKLIALAKGATTPSEEDDMPTADEIAAAVVTKLLAGGGALESSDLDRIWGRDVIPAPTDDPANPTWAPSTYLRTTLVTAQRVDRRTAELTAQVAALSSAVAALAQGGGLDAAEIQAAAEAGAKAALDRLGDVLTEES
jgi:outer membrane murein-binding lipoprotein Lpp